MKLNGRRIGILTTDGFDEAALRALFAGFQGEGAEVRLIGLEPDRIYGWNDYDWTADWRVDMIVSDVALSDFDAIVLPPGLLAVDAMRTQREVINFIAGFAARRRVLAAMGHAPLLLIEAALVRGRTVTGAPAIRTDLRNAGGRVREAGPVRDGPIVSSVCGEETTEFVREVADQLTAGAEPQPA